MKKRPTWIFVVGGLLVALLLAGVVSNFASSHPDGLDATLRAGCTVDSHGTITGGDCPARQTRKHELADSPLTNYGIRGVDNPYLANGLSGVLGVLLTFAIGGGLFWLVRRRAAGTDPGDRPAADKTPSDRASSDRATVDRATVDRAANSAVVTNSTNAGVRAGVDR